MKKALLLLSLCAIFSSAAQAQAPFMGELEFGTGLAQGLYKVKGEERSAIASATGGIVYARYTHYLNESFGFYASLKDINAVSGDYSFFGALNKADGQKYRYRFTSGEYDLSYDPLISIGAAYRLDLNDFDAVFRAGIGSGQRYADYSYTRQSRDGSKGPEYFSVKTSGDDYADYLLDSSYYTIYYKEALVFEGSAQLVWKFSNRVHLFAEAGFDWSPSRIDVTTTYTGSKSNYNPINWAEAVSYSDLKDSWTKDSSTQRITNDKLGMGIHLTASVGIGIALWKTNKD